MAHQVRIVGRAESLSRLERLLAGPEGVATVGAVVWGEPGIGKSRLLEEFASRAVDRGFAPLTIRGRPGTQAIPAGSLLSLLPTAPPAGDEASVLWWTRNSLVGLVERPVIVVDDAHLVDDLTMAVCGSIAESGRAPVVFAARSTEPHPDGLVQIVGMAGMLTLRIGSLTEPETAELLGLLVGGSVDPESVSEVVRLSGGVPLVLRELTRAAEEAGCPIGGGGWRWDPAIAAHPQLGSLLESRLVRASKGCRTILSMAVVAEDPIPEPVAAAVSSTSAVRETVERGLLVERGGWLEWSHQLLGELASVRLDEHELRDAGIALQRTLGEADLCDPEVLLLAAAVDLGVGEPTAHLQERAAEEALERGRLDAALEHACAAIDAGVAGESIRRVAAKAAIGTGDPDLDSYLRDLLAACRSDDVLLDAVRDCSLLLFTTSGDGPAAESLVSSALEIGDSEQVKRRLEHLRSHLRLFTSSPAEFVKEAEDYLDAEHVHPEDRLGVQGNLSIMLAVLGDVQDAQDCARDMRSSAAELEINYERRAGFYGGALASIFSGDAVHAAELVRQSTEIPPTPGFPDAVVDPSLGFTMDPMRGHAHRRMVPYVRVADEIGSLRYGVICRIYSVWELALARDPRAQVLWGELQAAPMHLRQGPGFLEAMAGVALVASSGDTGSAASMALELAEIMAPARSAAAWLLHDAARHGRAEQVVGRLEEIAAWQGRRFLPAMMADSARAMGEGDADRLVASAAEFRSGGFELFAAELDTLAHGVLAAARRDVEARSAMSRARGDMAVAGDPWSPILATLEPDPLTERQREICGLVAEGLTNAEVAKRLGISIRTVENQLHRSYAALGVDREGLRDLHF